MSQAGPTRPSRISDYAVLCLNALAEKGLGERISIGGALGLMHYIDYRETHDVDAWWLDTTPVCFAGLITAAECWRLWRLRQDLAGSDSDAGRARLALDTHLERISQHRPLNQIVDPVQRAEAEGLRTWFRKEFLDALG